MRTDEWHIHATEPDRPLPDPITAANLNSLSPRHRSVLAETVRDALLRAPVASPVHEAVLAELSFSLRSALSEPTGVRTILAVSAPNTAGKSRHIEMWACDLYRFWTGAKAGSSIGTREIQPLVHAEQAPVLYVSLSAAQRSKGLYVTLLYALGYPVNGSEPVLAMRVAGAFRNNGVRLLILDDAHMIATTASRGREVLDAIKQIATELGQAGGVLLLVGAGIDEMELVRDPQIARRLHLYRFAPYSIRTKPDQLLWQRFLLNCEKRILPYLPYNEPGILTGRNPKLVWERTQGYVGETTKLIAHATAAAVSANQPLSARDLDTAPVSERARTAFTAGVAQGHREPMRRAQ